MLLYQELLSKIKLSQNRCWIWTGRIHKIRKKSYPVLLLSNGKVAYSHRISFECFNDIEIPTDSHIHHKCKNTLCINPVHLELLSSANHLRLHNGSTESHCKYGHEFTTKNTRLYTRPDGRVERKCRECNRLNSLMYAGLVRINGVTRESLVHKQRTRRQSKRIA